MPEPSRLAGRIERSWHGARPLLALRPLAWLFRAVVAMRRHAFRIGLLRTAHPGVPVVVVGNLTAGGTGKTPLSLWLAQRLREQGLRPGIVLRGYGGRQRTLRRVQPLDDAATVGDEAVLLARRAGCPVVVGARRSAAAQLLVDEGCDIVIADDGLQHLALARDLSVLVIDGERGFGNGALLPAGPLREPASRLHAADLVVMHGEDLQGVLPAAVRALSMRLVPVALREVGSDRALPLHTLQGRTVHALAGIGHPQRFFALLRELGAAPLCHPLPDHHVPGAATLDLPGGHWIVMTEKDAVKCRVLAAGRDDLYYLHVSAVLPDADAAHLLDRVLSLRRT